MTHRRPTRPATLPLALAAACLGALAACASDRAAAPEDAMLTVLDPSRSAAERAAAVEPAWRGVAESDARRAAARRDLKALAWSASTPLPLRLETLRILLDDPSPAGVEDSRELVRLMLPREPQFEVIALLSGAAADQGWTDATPSLVRSLSRYKPGTGDVERPEYRALQRLHPGAPVERIVYETFLRAADAPAEPGAAAGVLAVNTAERIRADAWDVLARLDRDGSLRAAMIAGDGAAADDPAIADIRAALAELRTMPLTGEELKWLGSLRQADDPAHRAWWEQASGAIGALDADRTGRLRLHHAEPIRLAAERYPSWLEAARSALLDELRRRLDGREINRRTASDTDTQRAQTERLRDAEPSLSWGDALSILVIDEALRDPDVAESLFAQAEMDQRDTTAEYGGLLHATSDGGFHATLFPPRPAARRGDTQFVASTDMIAQGDHALAHYHFHAQRPRNDEYAGPSGGDLAYAARYGRACLLFTTVRPGVLGVDWYGPSGVVVDLGEIRRPKEN